MRDPGMTISQVARRTGVSVATLRMWEQRHGFPRPSRAAGGHRRYSDQQVQEILLVAAGRRAGLSLAGAIARARQRSLPGGLSLFASLRAERPELEARALSKPAMLALSHAIEDECLARAERPLLFACFQRERFYRRERARWRELSQGAALALVFADFSAPPREARRPLEVPISPQQPLAREWALVCDADGHAACLVGRERAGSSVGDPAARRVFDAVWSVEPGVVRAASRICATIASQLLAEAPAPGCELLEREPLAPPSAQLRLAAAIAARALAQLG